MSDITRRTQKIYNKKYLFYINEYPHQVCNKLFDYTLSDGSRSSKKFVSEETAILEAIKKIKGSAKVTMEDTSLVEDGVAE
jgi:hypothetical protein